MSHLAIYFDGGRLEADAVVVGEILEAFGLELYVQNNDGVVPIGGAARLLRLPEMAAETISETISAVALAHHLLGLKPEQFRETGLMLAQRPDTWREFDSARRLGAQTFELQRILLGGLFNEVPK